MFKHNQIKKRVMEVIEEKINLAQVKLNEEVEGLEEDHKITVKDLEVKLEEDKKERIDFHVNSIISKII